MQWRDFNESVRLKERAVELIKILEHTERKQLEATLSRGLSWRLRSEQQVPSSRHM